MILKKNCRALDASETLKFPQRYSQANLANPEDGVPVQQWMEGTGSGQLGNTAFNHFSDVPEDRDLRKL